MPPGRHNDQLLRRRERLATHLDGRSMLIRTVPHYNSVSTQGRLNIELARAVGESVVDRAPADISKFIDVLQRRTETVVIYPESAKEVLDASAFGSAD